QAVDESEKFRRPPEPLPSQAVCGESFMKCPLHVRRTRNALQKPDAIWAVALDRIQARGHIPSNADFDVSLGALGLQKIECIRPSGGHMVEPYQSHGNSTKSRA